MSPVEIVALIRTSAWSQRLWTFNEGRLSGERLWFQFQDKAVNLFDIVDGTWRAGMESPEPGLDTTVDRWDPKRADGSRHKSLLG
ncbi:hypothetical protein PG989_014857 [Apiospora arundinis]